MKRLILISLLLSSFILFHACERYCCDIPPIICCDMPKEIFINVTNSNAEDLLDQTKINSFKIEDFRVFHFYNNQNNFIVNSNNINQLSLHPKETLISYRVYLSEKIVDQKSRTIIKWSSNQLDTIDAFFQNEKVLWKLVINQKETILIDTTSQKNNRLSVTLNK